MSHCLRNAYLMGRAWQARWQSPTLQRRVGVWTGELDRLLEAYPRETQEMVFDAHDRAFAFFRGTCTRGIYGNMKTAVDTIFAGKDRAYNRRFMQMCGHYWERRWKTRPR